MDILKWTSCKRDGGAVRGMRQAYLLLAWDPAWLVLHLVLGAFTAGCRTARSFNWSLTCIPGSRVMECTSILIHFCGIVFQYKDS